MTDWELWVPFLHYEHSRPNPSWSRPWWDGAQSYWSLGPLDMLVSNRYSEEHPADRSEVGSRHNVFKALLGLIQVETGTAPTEGPTVLVPGVLSRRTSEPSLDRSGAAWRRGLLLPAACLVIPTRAPSIAGVHGSSPPSVSVLLEEGRSR